MNFTGSLKRIFFGDPGFLYVIKLDEDQFPNPWTNESWVGLNWNHHLLYSFEVEGALVGYCLFSILPGDDSAHLLKICLETSYRGSGVADHFWPMILDEVRALGGRSIYLEVEANNDRAIHFYYKNNFKRLRFVKGFYSNGADALTMSLLL